MKNPTSEFNSPANQQARRALVMGVGNMHRTANHMTAEQHRMAGDSWPEPEPVYCADGRQRHKFTGRILSRD